jgi:tRNA threonylcarbamoyladenosine biosynthesis protein TsaB
MNILAIETATETVGVAVQTTEGIRAELTLTGRRRHVESLAPAIEHLLGQVGLTVPALDTVAVDLGPGLFTGLRVGVAAAKGLAQALGAGVVGVTSLDILLRGAADTGYAGSVLAAVDARRGEVFATVGQVGPDGVTSHEAAQLWAPEALASSLADRNGSPVLAVGDGAQRYADLLGSVDGVQVVTAILACPPPATLLTLALEALARGEAPVAPALVVPLYMREADARSNFAQVTRP